MHSVKVIKQASGYTNVLSLKLPTSGRDITGDLGRRLGRVALGEGSEFSWDEMPWSPPAKAAIFLRRTDLCALERRCIPWELQALLGTWQPKLSLWELSTLPQNGKQNGKSITSPLAVDIQVRWNSFLSLQKPLNSQHLFWLGLQCAICLNVRWARVIPHRPS